MMRTSAGRRIRRPAWLVACLGVAAVLTAVPFAGSASAAPRSSALVADTPCHTGTVACVSLGQSGYGARVWFIRGGKVVRGPVKATAGGPGEDTPVGTFHVLSKDLHHRSSETTDAEGRPSDMPYAVFFTTSGVAFHGGGEMSTRTAGCVRLADSDASYFFNNLKMGDTVQVVQGGGGSQPSDHNDDSGDSGDSGSPGGLLGGL